MQLRQVAALVAATVVEYVPAGQFVHWELPLREYFPAEHGVQDPEFDTDTYPALQLVHWLAPARENVPAPQILQRALPAAE